MGLKYSLFLIKIGSKELFDKLIASGLTDQTEQMKKDAVWEKKNSEEFNKLLVDKTISIEAKLKKIDTMDELTPKDDDLRDYQRRQSDPTMTDIFIWWKQLPGTEYVFGGFTTYMTERRLFEAYASLLFYRAKLNEWMFIDYAHTMNEGNVLMAKVEAEKLIPVEFDYVAGEDEHFERYAKRVEKKTGYPITTMHKILQNADVIVWDHCVAYKIEKKAKAGDEKMS